MKFLSSFKAERCITQLLTEPSVTTPGSLKALEGLRRLGPTAIPKLIDAFATAEKDQTAALVQTLASQIDEGTIREVLTGLRHDNHRCVAGTAAALSASGTYDANLLVGMLGKEDVSVPAVIDVLRACKNRINPRELLRKAYDLEPRERSAAFRIIGDIATEELVPDLVARLEGKDQGVKMHLIEVLAKFRRPDVAKALEKQLGDRNKLVRKAAITALADMPGERDIPLLTGMLRDPDLESRNRAVDLLVRLKHPATMQNLVGIMREESEDSRRAAVEVLNGIADVNSLKTLLAALEDSDWWVRSRACDALAKIGGPKVMDAVLKLVGDQDENIRRAAIEILNQTKDQRAVAHLIKATEDADWWVRERAADALAEIGMDARDAIPALLKMLGGDVRSVPAAVRALGRLGDSRVLPVLMPLLNRTEKPIRVEAVQAVARLADEKNAATVKSKLQPFMSGADETIAKVAADAVIGLDNRFSSTAVAAAQKAERLAEPAKTLLVDGADVARMVEAAQTVPDKLDINLLNAGDVIEGRYRYIQKIGKGAFGTVLLVEDTVVEERLILKFLNTNVSQDEEMMKRFVHELRYSRKITHKNVIRIYDFLSLGGHYAISMEYFPSHTLGAEISSRKGPLALDKARRYTEDITTGMAVAHQVGVVHRDLKPANLLINDEGLLKIVDFGVAAAATHADTQLTKTGYVIGSPKYMAPEQILGKKVDHRADIYSVGVIMYEMLTGIPPYSKGDHMAVMYQHVQGRCKPCEEINPDIPAALAAVVRKTMEVDKNKRYESMDALREAVQQAT
jgi:HEAT repeat protein/tRNA A-37 threonylcarbamoyl transferase component Bud32